MGELGKDTRGDIIENRAQITGEMGKIIISTGAALSDRQTGVGGRIAIIPRCSNIAQQGLAGRDIISAGMGKDLVAQANRKHQGALAANPSAGRSRRSGRTTQEIGLVARIIIGIKMGLVAAGVAGQDEIVPAERQVVVGRCRAKTNRQAGSHIGQIKRGGHDSWTGPQVIGRGDQGGIGRAIGQQDGDPQRIPAHPIRVLQGSQAQAAADVGCGAG